MTLRKTQESRLSSLNYRLSGLIRRVKSNMARHLFPAGLTVWADDVQRLMPIIIGPPPFACGWHDTSKLLYFRKEL